MASEVVGLGSRVRLRLPGASGEVTLVGSASEQGPWRLAMTSPLGRALLGRRVGDTVSVYTQARTIEVEILSVEERG